MLASYSLNFFPKRKAFIFLTTVFLLVIQSAYSKDKYWIFFSGKTKQSDTFLNVSETAISNRKALGLEVYQQSDLPVNPHYVKCLSSHNVQIVCKSRWLNAVSAYLDQSQIEEVRKLTFVDHIQLISARAVVASSDFESVDVENFALEQMHAKTIQKKQIKGDHVTIGIIDGHFWKSRQNQSLQHVFKQNKLLGVKDFVEESNMNNFFDRGKSNNDIHGMVVWQLIAGYNQDKKKHYGLATNASFYLARTDDSQKEYRREEDYWIAALEWMDSLGVRLVNSSLGYSVDFDNPLEDHKPEDMNGATSAIAKAVQIAADEKGMIIVISAGNEGNNQKWKFVSTPADAEGVISVGATDKYLLKAAFSGIGPSFLSYLKPDISCFSDRGTSFSAPVITGLIACLLEVNPNLKSKEIKQLLTKSSHLYPFSNNYLGSGVPDIERIFALLKNPAEELSNAEEIREKSNKVILKGKSYKSDMAIVFHKENEKTVSSQTVIFPENNEFTIPKEPNTKRSTVTLAGKVIEIIWE